MKRDLDRAVMLQTRVPQERSPTVYVDFIAYIVGPVFVTVLILACIPILSPTVMWHVSQASAHHWITKQPASHDHSVLQAQ